MPKKKKREGKKKVFFLPGKEGEEGGERLPSPADLSFQPIKAWEETAIEKEGGNNFSIISGGKEGAKST